MVIEKLDRTKGEVTGDTTQPDTRGADAPISVSWLITRRPDVMGGSATIAGTRIRVSDVINHDRLRGDAGLALPFLLPEQVDAARRFYKRHQAEIDAEITEGEALAGQWPDST